MSQLRYPHCTCNHYLEDYRVTPNQIFSRLCLPQVHRKWGQNWGGEDNVTTLKNSLCLFSPSSDLLWAGRSRNKCLISYECTRLSPRFTLSKNYSLIYTVIRSDWRLCTFRWPLKELIDFVEVYILYEGPRVKKRIKNKQYPHEGMH